jgi:thiopurine S-methyltransferase
MDRNFWNERWNRGEIGFHQSDIHWALKRHWDSVADGHADRVLVPLCGKSLDLRWLAQHGHNVVGIEFSPHAVSNFYKEWGKLPTQSSSADSLIHWQAENVELFEGDFFDFSSGEAFELFYDRAALIALPREMRPSYLEHLRSMLGKNSRGLLVTFEYDQSEMDGPPFAVLEDELMDYAGMRFQLLERRDVLAEHARFAEHGLTALHECAWLVTVA